MKALDPRMPPECLTAQFPPKSAKKPGIWAFLALGAPQGDAGGLRRPAEATLACVEATQACVAATEAYVAATEASVAGAEAYGSHTRPVAVANQHIGAVEAHETPQQPP